MLGPQDYALLADSCLAGTPAVPPAGVKDADAQVSTQAAAWRDVEAYLRGPREGSVSSAGMLSLAAGGIA